MAKKIIKSAERVKNIGEVFTPQKMVDLMLDQPEIKKKVNSLTSTFLEPSAGEGAFLVEILHRKLQFAKKVSKDPKEIDTNFLIALSSLYGIELMEDNVEMLVMNMNEEFQHDYLRATDNNPNDKVIKSAKVIIRANMAQGDALTRKTNTGDPIIFSEWKPLKGNKVQRTEYTFDAIVEGSGPTGQVSNHSEQLDLFAASDYDLQQDKLVEKKYLPVKWIDVYKELVEQSRYKKA